MSEIYVFIATRTTYERVIPTQNVTQAKFNRDVAMAFQDFTGGTVRAGDLAFRTKPDSIANHLLCDGSEQDQISFPELYEYLGVNGAVGVGKFKLPGAPFTFSATTPTQVVEGGTVSTGGTVTQPSGAGQTGSSTGGNVPSGGRVGGFGKIPDGR